MKKLGLLFGLLVLLISCGKSFISNDYTKKREENIAEIQTYLAQNNLTYAQDFQTGIFYKKSIENPTGLEPNLELTAHIAYKISTLKGTVLAEVKETDSSFYAYSNNANIFEGFLVAVNSLREGEKGTFIIPSTSAFGDSPPTGWNLSPWQVIVLEIVNLGMYNENSLINLHVEKWKLGTPEITSSGLRILRSNPRPATADLKNGDIVNIKYKGYFLSKSVFDQGSFDYTVGNTGLINGFSEAVSLMRVTEKATIVLPSAIAYGKSGSSTGSIPPNTPIAFDIEITALK